MSNIVQIIKDVKPANREDLIRVLTNIQNILDSYFELQERLSKAPIVIKQYLEEHTGDVNSLKMLEEQITEMIKTVA
jgi:hypothetical protein